MSVVVINLYYSLDYHQSSGSGGSGFMHVVIDRKFT